MSADVVAGQARVQTLSRAFDALWDRCTDVVDVDGDGDADADERGAYDVGPLLWHWRQLRPRAHPGGKDDAVDVAALVDVLGRRPDALTAPLLAIDDDPRGRPLRQQLSRALADACILGLEQQKLRHGLTVPAATLKQFFASPDVARDTLVAVRDAAVPAVAVGSVVVSGKDVPAGAHVVAGAVARRLQDLLSPYVRRLRVDLALLGRDGPADKARVDDDDVYRGLARLNARAPACVDERRGHDDEFGDDGRVFVVDCARLKEDEVDRRARSLIAPLRKAGVVIVGVVDVAVLSACLRQPRSVQLLCPASQTLRPRVVVDGAGFAFFAGGADDAVGEAGDGACLSVVDNAFVSVDDDCVSAVDVACAAAAVARAFGPAPTIRLAAPKDESAVALEALAAMVPARR